MPLAGRRVLVTGASSGIDEATARVLSRHGARVALLARRRERLEALAQELGGVAVPADVADETAVHAAVDDAAEHLGGLDGLVNAAGVQLLALFADGRSDEWRTLVEVNLLGVLYTSSAALPHLRTAGGGDLVMLSSIAGRRVTGSTGAVYTGTKFALHAMSETLRRELHEDGVRVIVVAPGWVHTELGSGMGDADERANVRSRQEEIGLDPEVIGEEIAHAFGRPRGVLLTEIAVQSLAES